MKIAMLLDNAFIESMPYPKRVYYEAKSLINDGHDVTIYCKNELDKDLPKEEIKDGIKIKRCFDYFLGTSVLVDKYLKSHMDLYNGVKENYDVYHCYDANTWPIGFLLSKRDNAKFICESLEYFPDMICKEWHKNDLLKYELTKLLLNARGNYIKEADKVIVVSEPMADELESLYELQKRPTVIYNTRPFEEIKLNEIDINLLRDKYKINRNTKILLFQGNVEESRGIDIAVESMKYVDNAVLIIAGGGKSAYIDELKKIVLDLGIQEKVIFTGFMPSDELLKYSYCADIMIYFGKPSVKNMEITVPNKFFDYIFVGKPMIVSDLYSLKQIVNKYEIGEVINIHNINIKNIAQIINNLINDDEKIKFYTKNMKNIQKNFSWSKEEKKLFEIYESKHI